MSRVFLIVLDSFGVGAEPDAATFGDTGAHTLKTVSASPLFRVPQLITLGLSAIEGQSFLGNHRHTAAVARLQEASRGKDTTTGHWELAGIVSDTPFPTYPNGFPAEILTPFSRRTGRGILCNRPYSGTQVIRDYGEEHQKTGDLIVYTSADSVFQIAAHEAVVPPEQLYEYCRMARRLLTGNHAVGRVIARPFTGDAPHFTRTAGRRDFSLEPPRPTVLDALKAAGKTVIGIGKIGDIFAGRGLTDSRHTTGNAEGMEALTRAAGEQFDGLCFANLVDFDMLYGHRRDVDGYAAALTRFDDWLSTFLSLLQTDDTLLITADHGCDPAFSGTDHTREYVPLLIAGQRITPCNLGTLPSFTAVADLIAELLGVPFGNTDSILSKLTGGPSQ